MYPQKLVWLLVVVLCAVQGCSINGPNSTFEDLGDTANTRGFGRRFPHDPNENAFVFGPGDGIQITVEEEIPYFTTTQVIRHDGRITIRGLNDVTVGGLTPTQVRKKLETRLAVFIREPQVTVAVTEIHSKKYFVGGHLPQTGGTKLATVPYTGDVTLLDAWVQMGSPSSMLDDECHVKVVRGDPRKSEREVFNINMNDILEGRTAANIQIQPDDIVLVPPSLLGRINAFIAGVSVPFRNLFVITRSVAELDYAVRIISGDDEFRRSRVFF